MDDMSLSTVRRAYAEEIRTVAHLSHDELGDAVTDAFARVPREAFLGRGPWQIVTPSGQSPYTASRDADPAHLYRDVLVAIDPVRRLNNGHPSSLARWIAAAAPRTGETVLHLGAGTGYYSAIFAEIVGDTGKVVAVEIDPQLAARARDTLARWPWVEVVTGEPQVDDGTCDVVFVNAGATHVLPAWIRATAPGGRLVVPLTIHEPPHHGVGVYVCAERDGDRWPAHVVSQVAIYDCAGARDPRAEARLARSLDDGSIARLRALVTAPHERTADCLVHVPGACLQA